MTLEVLFFNIKLSQKSYEIHGARMYVQNRSVMIQHFPPLRPSHLQESSNGFQSDLRDARKHYFGLSSVMHTAAVAHFLSQNFTCQIRSLNFYA